MGDKMDLNKYTGHIVTGLVCAGVTFGACWYFMDYSRRDAIELGKKMEIVNECVKYMEDENYPFADNDPVAAAVQGYISALASDKYTRYKTILNDAVEETVEYVNTAGTAVASGFQIDVADDGNILISEITSGLAADKQGLQVGDVITAIDGVSVAEKGFENIANKMLGKQDTEVTFTVRRDGSEFDMLFKRDHEYINYADFEPMGDVAYVRLSQFEQFAEGQFNEALTSAESYDKMILDLRNNGGGSIDLCVSMASELCGHCKVTKIAYSGKEIVTEMTYDTKFADKKIIVLINDATASSGEIMTATTKQELGVTLVGTNTRGKGVYQNVQRLSNGDELRYTAGSYTVGDWECYHGVGIAPDVEVEMDPSLIGTDEDVQLQKALELLN